MQTSNLLVAFFAIPFSTRFYDAAPRLHQRTLDAAWHLGFFVFRLGQRRIPLGGTSWAAAATASMLSPQPAQNTKQALRTTFSKPVAHNCTDWVYGIKCSSDDCQ